jgi:hypothetical protein
MTLAAAAAVISNSAVQDRIDLIVMETETKADSSGLRSSSHAS